MQHPGVLWGRQICSVRTAAMSRQTAQQSTLLISLGSQATRACVRGGKGELSRSFSVGRSGAAVLSCNLGGSRSPWAHILPWTHALVLHKWLNCHGPQFSHLSDGADSGTHLVALHEVVCAEQRRSCMGETGKGSQGCSHTCCCDPPCTWLCSV